MTSSLLDELADRVLPGAAPAGGWWILVVLVAGLVVVGVPALWRPARLAVTIVHELGHAGIGILVGRRFTGFVVNGDMSGHAVTVGPRRGVGRVLSTWAGYPAPAVIGAVLLQIGLGGWSGTALTVVLLALLLALPFVRSAHTLLTVLLTALVVAVVWWWGGTSGTAGLCLGAGVLLLLGAWRHLGAVAVGGRRRDDPQQLAELTGVPAWVWVLSQLLVIAACSWWALRVLAPHVPLSLG